MSTIIQVEKVKQMLDEQRSLSLIDVRFDLADPSYGKKAYQKGHLPGSVYVDVATELSGEMRTHGGAHPLPKMKDFTTMLGRKGIDEQSNVVIYDSHNQMYAPRLWWMLHAIGHENVFVLDGGVDAWIKAGYPLETEVSPPIAKEYTPKHAFTSTVTIDEMKEKVHTKEAVLIDSRAPERYVGKVEPRYHKAGHIPGAVNYFWKDLFTAEGKWKSTELLEEHFASLPKDKEIIVSCGSGISACPNIVALKSIGFQQVTLYPGGYSDWISYENHPVETKDENNGQ